MSNRDSERNEDRADPLEIVLYAVFVATSARASVGELADILQVRAPAMCRLSKLKHQMCGGTVEGPAALLAGSVAAPRLAPSLKIGACLQGQ